MSPSHWTRGQALARLACVLVALTTGRVGYAITSLMPPMLTAILIQALVRARPRAVSWSSPGDPAAPPDAPRTVRSAWSRRSWSPGRRRASAHHLGLSHSTVKHHLANARSKVGAETTAQLVWILAPRLPEPEGMAQADE